jgi:hypothetical protein
MGHETHHSISSFCTSDQRLGKIVEEKYLRQSRSKNAKVFVE